MSEIPNTPGELIAGCNHDFTEAVTLIMRAAYSELGRFPGMDEGLFSDPIRRAIHAYAQKVGVERAQTLLRSAAECQSKQHIELSKICDMYVKELPNHDW